MFKLEKNLFKKMRRRPSWIFKMIKAYFFDWMGTLADVDNQGKIGSLLDDNQRDLLLTGKFQDLNISEGLGQRINYMLMSENYKLYSDTEEIISKLRLDYKLAIISNMFDIASGRIRESFPSFLSQFDVVTFSSEVGLKKPDLEIFRHTLNKLNKNNRNINPGEVMMVGDKKDKDIIPAINFGMQAGIIDRNKQNLGDIIFN